MKIVHAYAALQPGIKVQEFEYKLPQLGPEQVDIKIEYCGICHSDLSMLGNDWGITTYPLVAGHEVVGVIEEVGEHVKYLKIGQRVGLGWYSGSCMHCQACFSGNQVFCAQNEATIVARCGGFANKVRCNWEWAIPLPDRLEPRTSGPLFCGGSTVFNAISHLNIKPTARVGVIGIGGLGHLAIQFLNKWGCEVTAFTSSPNKFQQLIELGAHYVIDSTKSDELKKQTGRFDFIINTVNVKLDWNLFINALRPKGYFHTVGMVLDPLVVEPASLILQQRSISGSPLGSPSMVYTMLEFCERHKIAPLVEEFPMHEINKALEHLHGGKARYRVVLKAD